MQGTEDVTIGKQMIANRIYEIRKARGETQSQFVKSFNDHEPIDIKITRPSLANYETGRHELPASKWLKFQLMG